MTFRKSIFWCHLAAGLTAGVIIAIMSVTGIAIAFEEEILRWYDRQVSRLDRDAGKGNVPLPIAELTDKIQTAHAGAKVSSFAMFSQPGRAWEVHLGDEGPFYLDPFTGSTQASLAHDAHEVIHKLEEWHRWLGASDGLTSTGRVVTGISNLALVVLCVTGLYLWFPRRWNWRALRPLLLLKPGSKGKARDFNWHNVFGFWALPFVLVLSVTAVVISFEWGHRLVFILVGEEPPKSRTYGMMAVPPPVVLPPAPEAPPAPLDKAFARIAAAFPDWESITLEAIPDPAGSPLEPLEFGVTVPDSMPSRAYIPVKSHPFTGEILQQVRLQERSPGLQARVWIRFLHTGAAFGLRGKAVASLATAAVLVLVWTGFALSWRRFLRKSRSQAV
ncbi:MAG TPA: PepSY-associated TM helix domain-containing protein [Prosthecobacter sp.]